MSKENKMEQEQLKIFDENRKVIGVATRKEVHKVGHWHEVFHCWLVRKDGEKVYLYLQLRSETKKDYPSLYDITAAGHLLADESVQDGVRELKEELGVEVSFDELVSLGIIDYCVKKDDFIDKEIANIFLLQTDFAIEDFILQKEEVAGMVKVEFTDFMDLWLGKLSTITVSGYRIDSVGVCSKIQERVGKDRFVPHQTHFYLNVLEKINTVIEKSNNDLNY